MPRNVEILQALAPIIGAVAALFLVTRRRVIAMLLAAGATDPSSAVALPGLWAPSRFWTKTLVGAGVVGATGEGRYWLDEVRWRRYRDVRRRRGMAVFVCLSLAIALWWWFGAGRA